MNHKFNYLILTNKQKIDKIQTRLWRLFIMPKKLKHLLAFALAFMASYSLSLGMFNSDFSDADHALGEMGNGDTLDDVDVSLLTVNQSDFMKGGAAVLGVGTAAVAGLKICCANNGDTIAQDNSSPTNTVLTVPNDGNIIRFYNNGSDTTRMSFCNAGNTCYINTFLQTVFQFPNLVNLFYNVVEKDIDGKFWTKDQETELTKLLTDNQFTAAAQKTLLTDDSLYRPKSKEEPMNPLCAFLYKTVNDAKLVRQLSNRVTARRQQIRSLNFLKGMHKLVKTVVDNKKLTFNQWQEYCKLMGHMDATGIADDFWELATSSVKEYYGLGWGNSEDGMLITCPGYSIMDFALLDVFDKPLDIKQAVNTEFNQQFTAEDGKVFMNSLRAGLGFVCVKIPSYLVAEAGNKGNAKLKGLENTFETFQLQPNGSQEIWIDYNTRVEKAILNLKAITINYPGHWFAYTKHEDEYLKCNDGNISKVSKQEVMNDIINNPVGTNLYYAISKAD